MPAQSKPVNKPSKTSTVQTSSSNTSNTSSAPVSDVPLPEKKAKKTKVSATVTSPPTPVPDVSSVPAPVALDAEPSALENATDSVDTPLTELSSKFHSKLADAQQQLSSLKADFRALEKLYLREIKSVQKQCSKRKRKAGNRAPSGFVKPTRISDELANFLEKPSGSEMARTEVTREINKYIRNNKLQDKENGRKIIPDSKLSTLLKLTSADNLTYFNLQRYMSHHFAKANREVVA
jgi:chromatin remodeling complex protein RSC6